MILHHGSNVAVEKPELLPLVRALDFGRAFYLTTDFNQAAKWARTSVLRRGEGVPIVSSFEIDDSAAGKMPGRAMRFPPVGPLPFADDVYRVAAVGNYLVFFREVEGIVYVDRVLYKRRDVASLLGETKQEGQGAPGI